MTRAPGSFGPTPAATRRLGEEPGMRGGAKHDPALACDGEVASPYPTPLAWRAARRATLRSFARVN
jgi:hypothetical protein